MSAFVFYAFLLSLWADTIFLRPDFSHSLQFKRSKNNSFYHKFSLLNKLINPKMFDPSSQIHIDVNINKNLMNFCPLCDLRLQSIYGLKFQ
jgi:hypothetical protein